VLEQNWYDPERFAAHYAKMRRLWMFGDDEDYERRRLKAMIDYLQTLEGNIDSAAIRLRAYMRDLCEAVWRGTTEKKGSHFGTRIVTDETQVSKAFYNEVYTTITRGLLQEMCCNYNVRKPLDCRAIARRKVGIQLVAAMAGYWNAGTSFRTVLDYKEEGDSWEPKAMAEWAERLVKVPLTFSDLERDARQAWKRRRDGI